MNIETDAAGSTGLVIERQFVGFPSATQLTNGSMVIAYTRADQQGYFKIVGADGKSSSEISLGPLPSNISRVSLLTVIPTQDGGFMVSGGAAGLDTNYSLQGNPNNYRGPFYRFYDSNGNALTPFQLTDGTGYDNWKYGSENVALLPNNQVVSVGHTGNGAWHITANIQNMDGSYVARNIQIAQHGTSFSPKATLSTDGRHVLFVWSDLYGSGGSQDSSGSSVWGRVYDITTNQFNTSEFIINKSTQGDQGGRIGQNNEADNYSIVATNNGGFEVAFRSNSSGTNLISTTIGNAQSNFIVGSETTLNNIADGSVLYFDSAKLTNGNIFTAYSTTLGNGSTGGLFGKVTDQNGTTVLNSFKIGNTSTGSIYPRVSANKDNTVNVSWDAGSSADGGYHDAQITTVKISGLTSNTTGSVKPSKGSPNYTLGPARTNAGTVDAELHFIAGPGYEINGHTYVVTDKTYSDSDNVDAAITSLYGKTARLASWQDLQTDFGSPQTVSDFLSGIAMPVAKPGVNINLFVSNNGAEMDGGRGRFFITNFTGSSPSSVNYASFGNINNQIHLGSYWYPNQALVRID